MLGSRSTIFSVKTAAASAGVAAAAAAAAVALLAPGATAFLASEIPNVYSTMQSWLTPPYLYFVINGIIISIAASSRFQKATESTPAATPLEIVSPVEYGIKEEEQDQVFFVRAQEGYDVKGDDLADVAVVKVEKAEEEFVISRSSWTPRTRESSEMQTEYSLAVKEKPLVSTRFGHQRRGAKASPDGKALGVARPKRGETLESTWKAITDGRAVPLARHLKKSDTWAEPHGRARHDEAAPPPVRKSETFNDRNGRQPASPSSSSGGGRLRREPSLGQDDLNRRVEAFINKFNEEMRLQRQESCQQFLDMINRGSH